MKKISFTEACARYVHRFTMEHVPGWAKVVRDDGTYYAPQFRSDLEWYDNTEFPPQSPDKDSCYTSGQTWPLGQALSAPYVIGQTVSTVDQSGMRYLAHDTALNDYRYATLVYNVDQHAKQTEEKTGGSVGYKYVPLNVAMAAPELLAALKIANSMINAHFGLNDNDDGGNEEHDKIRAAIKLASHE